MLAFDSELKEAFSILHPLCVELSNNPSCGLLTKLNNALLNISPIVIDELQEFVLFSIRMLFKTLKEKPDNFKIEFFQCFNTLLTQSENIIEGKIFYELINNVILNICPPLPDDQFNETCKDVCEEIKFEGIRALDLLFSNASFEVLYTFYCSSSSMPFLGHVVTVLLSFIEKEKLRKLRFISMQALLRISGCCVEGPCFKTINSKNKLELQNKKLREKFCPRHCNSSATNDSCMRQLALITGQIFASFLPGISMVLTKVATGDAKQGQLVTAYAIAALSRILDRSFSDELVMSAKGKKITLIGEKDLESHRDLLVTINDDWVTGTSKKLNFLIGKIVTGSNGEEWKVRLELLVMSNTLLSNCCKSLNISSEKLLNVLISGLVDDEPIVKQLAQEVIQSLTSKLKSGSDLVDLLDDNLFKLVGDLPTLLYNPSDQKKLSGLRLLHGHLEMLGERSSLMMSSTFLMDKFKRSLFDLLEFDCTTLVICDNAGGDLQLLRHGLTSERPPSYQFKKFKDDRILEEVIKILNLIGRFWDLEIFVRHLLEAMMIQTKFKKQCALCLVHILDGRRSLVENDQSQDSESAIGWIKLEAIVDDILGQVLDRTFWSQICEPSNISYQKENTTLSHDLNSKLLITKRDNFGNNLSTTETSNQVGPSLKKIKEESIFACLLLDVIGASALLIGSNFEAKVVKVLVPILERIGSGRHDIRVRALMALHNVSWATSSSRKKNINDGMKNVVIEMLMRCSDYLMSSIIPSLRAVSMHPGVLVALRVVVELGTPKGCTLDDSMEPLTGDSMLHSLAQHQHMMQMIFSSFKQIITSFDHHHHHFFCLDFLKLLLQVSLLVSRTIHLEKLQKENTDEKQSSSSSLKTSQDNKDHDDDDCFLKEDCLESRQKISSKALVDYVLELERNRRIVEMADDDDDGRNVYEKMKDHLEACRETEVCDDDETEKKVEVPYYVAMLEQIMDRCQHFLISHDAQVRMVTLDIISVICPVLKPFQDNLLPLVHKIWSPFTRRFSDDEHFVFIKAFDALTIIADSSGDFVRRRVVKDVMPKVTNLLTSLVKKSYKAPPNYKFSPNAKFQKCILKRLGDICKHVSIDGQPLCELIKACIPYLSALQPVQLQEACLETFKEFISIDSDMAWLLLTEVYCPNQELNPPPGDIILQTVKLTGPTKRNEFTDNATKLYNFLCLS